jgi:hypothetical protein
VKDFNAIRDYLYAKMRGVRDEAHDEPAAQATSADALLVEIRDALNDAARALKEGH